MNELPIYPKKYYLQRVTSEGVRLIVPAAFNRAMAAVNLATVTMPAGYKVVKPEYDGFTVVTGLSILTGAPLRLEPYIITGFPLEQPTNENPSTQPV